MVSGRPRKEFAEQPARAGEAAVLNVDGNLGAAFLAGLRAGVFSSLDQIAALWHCDRRFSPVMPSARRASLYAGWLDAVRRVATQPAAG